MTQESSNQTLFWEPFLKKESNPYILEKKLVGFRCLFVFVTKEGDFSKDDYPISIGTMASLVRMNGGTARIHFQEVGAFRVEDYQDFDLICFYPMIAVLPHILELSEKIKSEISSSRICLFNSEQHQHENLLGVPGTVHMAKQLMEMNSAVDYVLIGEAERSFVELCRRVSLLLRPDSGIDPFSQVPSLVYRDEGKVRISLGKTQAVQFDFLPFPSRDYIEEGLLDSGFNRISARVQSSRGCLARCSYCVEASANREGVREKAWVGRDILEFVDEVELLSKKYGVIFFNVMDSSFEDPGKKGIKRMEVFCDEILDRGIRGSFKIHFRAETVSKLDDAYLNKLKAAGVDVIIIGAESGLDAELATYKKITNSQTTLENVTRLDQTGKFFTLLGHMMFSPFIDLEDLPSKIKYLQSLDRGWDYLNMSNNVLVFRGTVYHRLLESKGMVREDSSGKFVPLISYVYQDPRVEKVADEMGRLKHRCSDVVLLQNLTYDCLNILSRFQNRMNEELWALQSEYQSFQQKFEQGLKQLQGVYSHYLLGLVDLMKEDHWGQKSLESLYFDHISDGVPDLYQASRQNLADFLKSFEDHGLSTQKLYLKTWLSLINTEVNSSRGQVNQ